MPDNPFADSRIAALYDPLDRDRTDLDVYAAIVDEFGAMDPAQELTAGAATSLHFAE